MFVIIISEPITVINFFVLEHGRLEEFIGAGIAEMRERGLVLAHQVNDVTQRLNGHLVALQCGHNDLPQLLNDTGMVGRGDGNIRECGHDLATERCQLLGASPAALTGIKCQKPI